MIPSIRAFRRSGIDEVFAPSFKPSTRENTPANDPDIPRVVAVQTAFYVRYTCHIDCRVGRDVKDFTHVMHTGSNEHHATVALLWDVMFEGIGEHQHGMRGVIIELDGPCRGRSNSKQAVGVDARLDAVTGWQDRTWRIYPVVSSPSSYRASA